MQVYFLKTVVEQLVDDSKSDDIARKLLEEQYAPSLMVGHATSGGAPVVFEPHPTYDHLSGRIAYSTAQGAPYPPNPHLRPGTLPRAKRNVARASRRESVRLYA